MRSLTNKQVKKQQGKTLYDKAFVRADELISKSEALEKKAKKAIYPPQKRRCQNSIRKLNDDFKKLQDKYQPLYKLLQSYEQNHAGPFVLASAIKWIRSQGYGAMVEDAALRAQIKFVTGFEGVAGRPKNHSKH